MKAKIRPSGNQVFRSHNAIVAFDKAIMDSDIDDYGVDVNGNIYFSWLNGVTKRYTRREFVNQANNGSLYIHW